MELLRYISKRIILACISLIIVITITFFLMQLLPGDPFMSEKSTPEIRATLISKYGLDQPVHIQYIKYLKQLFKGDMGTSYVLQKGRAVSDIIRSSFFVSMKLGLAALIIALTSGIFIGCMAGLHKDKTLDKLIRIASSLGVSMPAYVTALFLMIIFSVKLGLLPISYSKAYGAILPVITLAIYPACSIIRIMRASIMDSLSKDYILMVRAKGLSESRAVFVHGMKNAIIPVITYLAPMTAFVLTGSFVTESVFNVPGLGRYFVSSISCRDYTMIMGITLIYASIFIFMSLISDILYKAADPRITLK